MNIHATQGETPAHQRAKAEIMRACGTANYEAVAEFAGDGWRADVLASRGDVRIAFEVQWSFLKLRDTLARQRRYAEAGVRGCWFFRHPPAQITARRDLPLFHLYANADDSFTISLNGTMHPFEVFVTRLLQGRVRFCETAQIAPQQTVNIGFYALRCPHCGQPAHRHRIESALHTGCGYGIAPPEDQAFLALPEVRAAVAPLYRAEPTLQPLSDGEICPHCGTPFSASQLELAHYGVQPVLTRALDLRLRHPLRLSGDAAHHWCCPDTMTSGCG